MNRKTLSSLKLISNKAPHFATNITSSIASVRSVCQRSDLSLYLPDLSNCISSLQACALYRNLSKGKEIHSWIIVNGFLESPFSVTSLINMYSKCDCLGDAIAIFDRANNPNVFAWNAVIAGFITNGLPGDAVEFYMRMRQENISPDKFTFPCMIRACSDVEDLREGKKIHAGVFKFGCQSDVYVASALINLYLKFNQMQEAQQVFDRLFERDVVLWNAMINGYAQIGEFNKALVVLGQMLEEAITPSKFTVTGILSVFATTEDLRNGQKIHGFVEKIGYSSDVVVSNSLIDLYGKCKLIEDALEIFERMPQRDIFSWNSILSVYEQSGDHDGTLRLFDRMRGAGIQSDTITISTILPVCSHLAALMHGREIHGYMIVSGMRRADSNGSDVHADNAIIDMYAKCGCLRDARLVFDAMMHRDVASWNIMILGYGLHGHGHEALDIFSSMCTAGVTPDEVTFVGVLSACSHAGMVDPGLEILEHMEPDHGVTPTVEHYACAVDMLGRAGRLKEAYELAVAMPIEPNPVVWRALLAACRLHGDAALAEISAGRLFELDPRHCGTYVLLSNVYGGAGRYKDVSDIRQTMWHQNVRKTPGCSWIELNTGVHVFVMGDRNHRESDQIYAQLQTLIGQLREYGYIPNELEELENGGGAISPQSTWQGNISKKAVQI